MEKFNPNDFQTLFRLDVAKGRVTGMLSDFIIRGTLKHGNPIITFDGQWWTFRLNRKTEKLLGERGLRLFGSKKNYSKYAKDFREYIDFAKENIIKKYNEIPSEISKEEFVKLINDLKKFWKFYGMTEFVYHDFSHGVMIEKNNSGSLKSNLEDLETLKFQGRDVLNSYILENGVIDNILKFISKKYLIDRETIKYFYVDELKKLFNEKRVNIKEVEKRKKHFVISSINNKVQYLENNNSKETAALFEMHEKAEFEKSANGLKGQIAYKGKVTGKVVISPMLDIKAAMEVEKRMNRGDILIVQSTNPDLMALCNKAGAIITDQGGMLSHAAIISRELKVPCIVGTVNATKVFKDGDMVEVDADNGIIKKVK